MRITVVDGDAVEGRRRPVAQTRTAAARRAFGERLFRGNRGVEW